MSFFAAESAHQSTFNDNASECWTSDPRGPRPAQPGTDEPGTAETGTAEPGTAEPGTAEPRTVKPGRVRSSGSPTRWFRPGTTVLNVKAVMI